MKPGRHAILLVALAAFACAGAANAQPPVRAFPPRDVPRVVRGSERFRSSAPVVDSLAVEDILRCTSALGFRIRSRHGKFEGTFARAEAQGLRLSDDTREYRALVPWDEIVSVDIRETRERTGMEAFERGSQIGGLVAIGIALIAIRPPGGVGDWFYPLGIIVAAVPGALIGGAIGVANPGQITEYDHCWP